MIGTDTRQDVLTLPRLSGVWGACIIHLYRFCALAALVVVIGGFAFNSLDLFRNIPAAEEFGFRTFTDTMQLPMVGLVTPMTAAHGLRVGDRILGIDGQAQPLRTTEFTIGKRLAAVSGNTVSLDVLGTDRVIRWKVRVPRIPGGWLKREISTGLPLWAYCMLQLIESELPSLILLCASILLYMRRPRDPEAMLMAFAFLPLCFFDETAFWLTALFHVHAIYFNAIVWAGIPLIFIAVAGFPDGRFRSRWTIPVLIGSAILIPANVYALSVRVTDNTMKLGQALTVLLGVVVVSAIVALVQRYRQLAPGDQRQQMKWAMAGAVLTAIFGIAGLLTAPLTQQFHSQLFFFAVNGVWHLGFFTALPIGMLVSVLGYRLYDSETAITRSATIAVVMVTMVAIFATIENTISSFGQTLVSGHFGSFAGGIAAALTATTINPVHTRIKTWADRSFRTHLFHLKEVLPPLVGDLRETTYVRELALITFDHIETGVRASSGAILFGKDIVFAQNVTREAVAAWRDRWSPPVHGGLDCARTDAIFPLRVPLSAAGIGQVGWLLLGPRPDGSFYGKDERSALSAIADPVARALAIAATREARSERHENLVQSLQHEVEMIKSKLAAASPASVLA